MQAVHARVAARHRRLSAPSRPGRATRPRIPSSCSGFTRPSSTLRSRPTNASSASSRAAEQESYYRDMATVARIFGTPGEVIPPTLDRVLASTSPPRSPAPRSPSPRRRARSPARCCTRPFPPRCACSARHTGWRRRPSFPPTAAATNTACAGRRFTGRCSLLLGSRSGSEAGRSCASRDGFAHRLRPSR